MIWGKLTILDGREQGNWSSKSGIVSSRSRDFERRSIS